VFKNYLIQLGNGRGSVNCTISKCSVWFDIVYFINFVRNILFCVLTVTAIVWLHGPTRLGFQQNDKQVSIRRKLGVGRYSCFIYYKKKKKKKKKKNKKSQHTDTPNFILGSDGRETRLILFNSQ
jgi:hypothetical protein